VREPPYYDPYDHEIDVHAQEVWRRLRDEAPLYRNERYDFYALSRYDDVLEALVDTATYSSAHGILLEMIGDEVIPLPMMIMRDPPEHTRLRSLASRAFTPRAIAGLEARVAKICASLLDPYVGSGGFDYVDDFGALLPPTVILALLGFPEGVEREWRAEVDAGFDLHNDQRRFQRAVREQVEVSDVLGHLLTELVAQRRREPEEDLISVLVHAELVDDGGDARPMTMEEIEAYVLMIAAAGTETVARLLGWTALLLARHPEQQRLLRTERARISNAVEEILRYEAPSPVQGRWVTRDVELHGQVVARGSKMLLLNGSADRDERHFPNAGTLDVTRTIDRHLAFGYGAHFCIGAALARLEARIALEATFDRFSEWQVDDSVVEWVTTSSVRGFKHVPIHFASPRVEAVR
jgi:cytochrome P450